MSDKTLTKDEAAQVLGVPVREVQAVTADLGGTVVTVKAGVKHLIRSDGSTALVNRQVEGYPTVAAGEGNGDGGDGLEAQPDAHAAIEPASTKASEPAGPGPVTAGPEAQPAPSRKPGRGVR